MKDIDHILRIALAKETKTSLEAVDEICGHYAKNIVEMARGAHTRCPDNNGDRGKLWMETAMASHAASNPKARKVIELMAWKLFGEGF